jgi:hypothetical protein
VESSGKKKGRNKKKRKKRKKRKKKKKEEERRRKKKTTERRRNNLIHSCLQDKGPMEFRLPPPIQPKKPGEALRTFPRRTNITDASIKEVFANYWDSGATARVTVLSDAVTTDHDQHFWRRVVDGHVEGAVTRSLWAAARAYGFKAPKDGIIILQ